MVCPVMPQCEQIGRSRFGFPGENGTTAVTELGRRCGDDEVLKAKESVGEDDVDPIKR